MAKVVGLNGHAVDAEIPPDSTPEAVLQKLLDEIRAGTIAPIRIIIAVEADSGVNTARYFNRSSNMTNAEAVTLTAIGHRVALFGIVDF